MTDHGDPLPFRPARRRLLLAGAASLAADLDAFVFLGDYIYEYATGGYAEDRGRQTGQDFECETVDQYRQRYALYAEPW